MTHSTHPARGRPGLAGGTHTRCAHGPFTGASPTEQGRAGRAGPTPGKGLQAGSWAPRLPQKSAGVRGQG